MLMEGVDIMEINTKYHGIRNYKTEDIITFRKGLPGFEGLSKFIMFPIAENEVYSVLHSLEDVGIGFVVVSPFNVIGEYEINLEDNVVEELKIKESKEVMIFNTITLNSNLEDITVNLKAPIIININERLGEQIIVDDAKYSIKHPLIQG